MESDCSSPCWVRRGAFRTRNRLPIGSRLLLASWRTARSTFRCCSQALALELMQRSSSIKEVLMPTVDETLTAVDATLTGVAGAAGVAAIKSAGVLAAPALGLIALVLPLKVGIWVVQTADRRLSESRIGSCLTSAKAYAAAGAGSLPPFRG